MRRLAVLVSLVMITVLMATSALTVSAKKVTPVIVINEVMANPRSVTDNDGEWIELYNPTAHDTDINGWTIYLNDNNQSTIENGEPLIIQAGGFLVLGPNNNPAENGGVAIDYQYPYYFDDGIGLSNSGDEVTLFDTDGNEIDFIEYPYSGGGYSQELINPDLDNSTTANWVRASTPYNSYDNGTPGLPNQFLPNLIQESTASIGELADVGILNGGQSNSLLSKLENALAKLESGNDIAALNQLNAFINQVNTFVNNGILSPEQGEELISYLYLALD
ncbi:lamin tail domain-containing protein [Chloroflexota bacterium]